MMDWEKIEMNGPLTPYNKPFVLQRADPYVCRGQNGTYYFTGSYPAYDRIVLRASTTLDGLTDAPERVIWTRHESGPMSCHIWAPEMHYVFGKWHMYFAASERDDIWKLRPYVLACDGDPMTDAWHELGQMQPCEGDDQSFRDFSLDATIFQRGDEVLPLGPEGQQHLQPVHCQDGRAQSAFHRDGDAHHPGLRLGTHWLLGERGPRLPGA